MTEPDERKFNGGDIEPQLSAFIQHLLEIADCSLTSPILNKDTPVKKTKNKKRNEVKSIEEQAKNLRMGKHHVEVYAPNLIKVIKMISDPGRPSVSEYGLECLWNVLAGAFLIGSRGVVTEGAKEFYRPEIEGEFLSAKGSKGGEKSGEARRNKAEAKWDHALTLAKEILAECSGYISQENLAAEIYERWKLTTDGRPGIATLVLAIRNWERSRIIERHAPKTRAIR